MKFIITLYFVFFFGFSYGQTKKFNNSAVKGKAITCPGYVEKYPCYNSTCRKIGKWFYYYDNGHIERIENYKKICDCSTNEIPDGLWQYFNERGLLIRQENYKNGLLWTSEIAKYYLNNKLAGEILVKDGIRDTLEFTEPNAKNLIKNGDFNLYYGPPDLQIGDGQKQIEKQIPFWFSPDNNTPDYYNQFRRLKNVPNNQSQASDESYNYVGIILYHKPTGKYSEFITGEFVSRLVPNKVYCLKIRIRLSLNSGFYVNRIAAYLSDSVLNSTNIIENSKMITPGSFNKPLDIRSEWKTLCAFYTASGNEKYITIGRYSNMSETSISNIQPLYESPGEYNQSAYYIIDKVEMIEDTTGCNCSGKSEDTIIERLDFDLLNPTDTSFWNKTLVLKNIFFDFDKSELLPESFKELENLLAFLKANHMSIIISGHTDNSGSDEYNKALSLSRAASVSEWLINNGINKERIQIDGFGAEIPIVDNDSEENRRTNRRVEFKIKRQ